MSNKSPYYADNVQEYYESKSPEEKIADSLEKIVQLLDYQNKMLTNIASSLRKGK